jgi:hypothetical protein
LERAGPVKTNRGDEHAQDEGRLTRAIATLGVAFLAATGAAVISAPAAFASNCTWVGTHQLCGAVKNRTGRTMSYTINLGYGGGFCDVWNKSGLPLASWWHAPCDQHSMGNGTRGGNGTGIDVDAFTFNREGYHERFSRVGTWHWRASGVWTKFPDGSFADCGIGDGNEIWCTVLGQVG